MPAANSVDFAREQMVRQQVRAWEVLDDRVLAVFEQLPRERFVPAEYAGMAFADAQIPLSEGECMLEPKLTGRILQALAIEPGERVLEVGTGSGFLSACMAHLGATVRSVERHATLVEAARQSLARCDVREVEVVHADIWQTMPAAGLYDVIVLTGSLPQYQAAFETALRPAGRLFSVVGEGPVMAAQLRRRITSNDCSVTTLFETSLPPLFGAARRERFQF